MPLTIRGYNGHKSCNTQITSTPPPTTTTLHAVYNTQSQNLKKHISNTTHQYHHHCHHYLLHHITSYNHTNNTQLIFLLDIYSFSAALIQNYFLDLLIDLFDHYSHYFLVRFESPSLRYWGLKLLLFYLCRAYYTSTSCMCQMLLH